MEDSRHAIKLTRTAKLTAQPDPVPPNAGEPDPPLPRVGILAGLNALSLKYLAAYGNFQHVAAGEVLVREGSEQDRLYVVVEGRLALTAKRGGKEVPVSEVRRGECLGEVSLLEPGPAAATIRVVEDAVLWDLDITGLRIYISDHSGGAGALLMGMASCLSARLREANRHICQHHILPVETLPAGRERAITASNAPIQPGFFDRIKKSFAAASEKKVRISTKIKM